MPDMCVPESVDVTRFACALHESSTSRTRVSVAIGRGYLAAPTAWDSGFHLGYGGGLFSRYSSAVLPVGSILSRAMRQGQTTKENG